MEDLAQGIQSFFAEYVQSVANANPALTAKQKANLVQLLVKSKHAQKLIFELLGKLTPLITKTAFPTQTTRPSYLAAADYSIRPLKPFRPTTVDPVSRNVARLAKNATAMREQVESVQEQYQQIEDLDVELVSETLQMWLEQGELRRSVNDEIVGLLEGISGYVPPDFLDSRDISHEGWKKQREFEQFLEAEGQKLRQQFHRIDAKYFYRQESLRIKTGLKIAKLEEQLAQMAQQSQQQLDRLLMANNDMLSAMYEEQQFDEALEGSSSEVKVDDYPTALGEISRLKRLNKVTLKELKLTQKNLRNANNRINVMNKTNEDLFGMMSTHSASLIHLKTVAYYLVDKAKLTDSDKERCKELLDKKQFQTFSELVLSNSFTEKATSEFLLKKIQEIRNEVNQCLRTVTDRKSTFALLKILETSKTDHLIEESDKQSFERFTAPEKSVPPKVPKQIEPKLNLEALYEKNTDPKEDVMESESSDTINPSLQTLVRQEVRHSGRKAVQQGTHPPRKSGKFLSPRAKVAAPKFPRVVSDLPKPPSLGSDRLKIPMVPQPNLQDDSALTSSELSVMTTQVSVPVTQRMRFPVLSVRPSVGISIQPTEKRTELPPEKPQYKPPPVITRVQTPTQLQPLKDKLTEVLVNSLPRLPPGRSRYSLTELVTIQLGSKQVWEILGTLLTSFTARRCDSYCQTELSFDIRPQLHRGIIAALAAKSQAMTRQREVVGSDTFENWFDSLEKQVKLDLCLVNTQLKSELQSRGLKDPVQQDLLDSTRTVLDERVQTGEPDCISLFLRGLLGTDQYVVTLKEAARMIRQKNTQQLVRLVFRLPVGGFAIEPRLLYNPLVVKKWGILMKRLLIQNARSLGTRVQAFNASEQLYEMSTSIQLVKKATLLEHKVQAKDEVDYPEAQWQFKAPRNSKKQLGRSTTTSLKRHLTHSLTPAKTRLKIALEPATIRESFVASATKPHLKLPLL